MIGSNLQYFVLICDKTKKKKFTELVASFGGVSTETVYGCGSAKASTLARALGLEAEEHKVVITTLMPTEKARALIDTLNNDYDFKGKNTGIAFSIAVEGLSI